LNVTVWGDDRVANVLVTSAGRRTALVQSFVDAAHTRGARVVACDVDALAPALQLADAAVSCPRTGDPDHIAALLRIVDAHAISLLVPTIDPDLAELARHRDAFAVHGCRVLVSSVGFIDVVLDKFQTQRVFGAAGIAVPRTWLPSDHGLMHGDLPERVFVKPRQGSASVDAYEVETERLPHVLAMVADPLIQEVLTGPEITVDALLDLDGHPVHYVPRQRLRTVGGESVQGITLPHDASLAAWIERVLAICHHLGASGPITLQAFLTANGPVLSEINARFGGGFPLALRAGAAYPAWIMDMVAGRSVEPRFGAYEAGLYMTRHNVERFLRQPAW
jgi:carbamoyl-phosphate synthase large subunit